MNTVIYNTIYQRVKSYLSDNSLYSPTVVKGVPSRSKYPLVVVYEIDNYVSAYTTCFEETKDNYIYEFDIYAKNQTSGATVIASIEIAREIVGLIDKVMSNIGGKRAYVSPTPNIDKTLYRIVARYNLN